VSGEAIRLWCRRFGLAFAAGLRRRRARAGDRWHRDGVQLTSTGRRPRRWRAVDRDGVVPDVLVQERRNPAAAARCLRRVLGGEEGAPRVAVTDSRARSPPALRRVLPPTAHRRPKGSNNRAEHSHRAVRQRERALQRFTSPEHAQRLLDPCTAVGNHVRPRRHRLPAERYRQLRTERFRPWREVARLPPAV
jgi:putative transposase